MLVRILPFTLAVALLAAALPVRAYDPMDPTGPSPDDPSAWITPGDTRDSGARPSPQIEPCRCAHVQPKAKDDGRGFPPFSDGARDESLG